MTKKDTANQRLEAASKDEPRQSDLTPIAILIQRMVAAGKLPLMATDEKRDSDG